MLPQVVAGRRQESARLFMFLGGRGVWGVSFVCWKRDAVVVLHLGLGEEKLLPQVRVLVLKLLEAALNLLHGQDEQEETGVRQTEVLLRLSGTLPALHLAEPPLGLERLVRVEEVDDLGLDVRRHVRHVVPLGHARLLLRHGHHLDVRPLLVGAHDGAHDAHVAHAHLVQRVVRQHKHVHGAAVLRDGLRDEAVVAGPVGRRVKRPAKHEAAQLLAELVLHARALRALDDGRQLQLLVVRRLGPRQAPQVRRVRHLAAHELLVVREVGAVVQRLCLLRTAARDDADVGGAVLLGGVRDELLVALHDGPVEAVEGGEVRAAGVVDGHGEHLVVLALLARGGGVRTLQEADEARVHEGLGDHGEDGQHQHVHRLLHALLPRLAHPARARRVRQVEGVAVVAERRVVAVAVADGAALGRVDVAEHADVGRLLAVQHVRRPELLEALRQHVLLTLLPLVALAALLEDLQRLLLVEPAQHLRPLRLAVLLLQQLVRLEEVLDLLRQVRRDRLQVGDVRRERVALQHADDLLVATRLVLHVHHADDAAVRDGARLEARRLRRVRADDEQIKRVAVAAQRGGDVPVVAWVVHGRVQHTVQHEHARVLLHLVLVRAAARHLHHDRHHVEVVRVRRARGGRAPVPEGGVRRRHLFADGGEGDNRLIDGLRRVLVQARHDVAHCLHSTLSLLASVCSQ
eukprot:Rhum_TRINITY_DN2308_c0_g2::Rhum_TRINITY_DN2308_c0_g2_i1::g.6808::m.6808